MRSIPVAALLGAFISAVPAPALADCADRQITFSEAVPLTCQGDTSVEINTFDPGITGCVEAGPGSVVATPGRDHTYAVTLPAFWSLDVVVTPDSGWDPAVYALSSDDPDSATVDCLVGVDAAFDGDAEILRGVTNDTGADATIYLVVDSASGSSTFGSGPYSIEFRPTPRPTGGEDCADPIEVVWVDDEYEATLSTCGAANDLGLGAGECFNVLEERLPGRDLVFAISVPDSTEWWAEIIPDGEFDVAAVASDVCDVDMGACLFAIDDAGVGGREDSRRVGVFTGTGLETTHYLVVDSAVPAGSAGGCGSVTVRLFRERVTTGTGSSCDDPVQVDLASGFETREGWTCARTSVFGTDGSSCGTTLDAPLTGPEVIYALTLPDAAGGGWSVQVAPRGEWNPAILVSTSCSIDDCIAVVDNWGVGKGEFLTDLDVDPEATVYVMVESTIGTPDDCGAFDVFFRGDATPVRTTSWGALKSVFR